MISKKLQSDNVRQLVASPYSQLCLRSSQVLQVLFLLTLIIRPWIANNLPILLPAPHGLPLLGEIIMSPFAYHNQFTLV